MQRLIEKGLMFANLVAVESPALVHRYNRALEQLTGKRTALTDFHVDISGYSPEIGEELGDELYLNANGCNRQFILLTTAQKAAPLLNEAFSTSRWILQDFIDTNEAALFALTTQDALAGELLNSVFEMSQPSRLFDIRRIEIEADTTQAHVADAHKLQERIQRFRSEPDAWWDDVLIAEMITLAKHTGDVTRNPVAFKTTGYEHGNFWTAHFGGAYVFHRATKPFVAAATPEVFAADPDVTIPVIGLADANSLARMLAENHLAEPIVRARGADGAAILRQKMDFVLVTAAAQAGLDLSGASRRDLRALARQMGAALPAQFRGLADLLRWVETGGDWPRISSEHPAYFYTLRGAWGDDRDLVNMLLSELGPMDFRQLFICNKPLFYRLYAGWGDAHRQAVADILEREYLVDKAGAREALFGAEPPMAPPPPPPRAPTKKPPTPAERMIARVGPWGAVRR